MKKKFIISFFILTAALSAAAQQRFKAGLKAGLSTSQVHGDTYAGFHKSGFAGGFLLNARLNDKWKAQFEMLYIQKGSRHNANPEAGDFIFYLMKLNYIEVPLLFQYKIKKFVFELGPAFGYLINAREFDYFGEFKSKTPFQKYELGAIIGVNYIIVKRLSMNWRYSNSLLPIRKFTDPSVSSTYNPGQRNNVLAFSLTYTFGKSDE